MLPVHSLVKHYKTAHLRELFETTLKSGFPLAKEQAELLHCITKVLAERGEIEGYSPEQEEADDKYILLLKRCKEAIDSLPEGAHTIDVVQAIFQQSTGEELLTFKAGFFPSENDTISGRDAEAPQVKPKPFRYTLIAASLVVALFLANTITVLATGFDFFGTLAKWSQDTVHFIWGEQDDSSEINTSAYRPLENVLNSLGIHVDLPRFAPDRFEIFLIEPEEPSAFSPVTAWFIDGDEFYHIRVKRMSKTETHSERNEDEEEEIYDGKFMVLSNYHRIVAVWYQGIYELSIHGNLTHEELTRILDSI